MPLDPDKAQREELNSAITSYLETYYESVAELPARGPAATEDLIGKLLSPPPEEGRELTEVFSDLGAASEPGTYHLSGGHMSYVPNAGLYSGAAARFLAAGLNRYTGVAAAAPGLTAIEHGVTRWITGLFDYPESAAGVLLSGGSMANFTGIVAARTAVLSDDFTKGVMYVTPHTHHSVAKSARLAGFRDDQIRDIPIDADLRMRPDVLAQTIRADRAAGFEPFLVVGSAGSTDTGSIDPLDGLAEVTSKQGLWLHVDGAYGGFFRLTERGTAALEGIDRADSIALDPHKGLSMPFGVGALIVREQSHLLDAHRGRGAYLLDDDTYMGLRDISALTPELTRPSRGLSVWLPLQLHGVAAFRDALDTSLDLAALAYERLTGILGLETPWSPDLSIVAFRFENDDVGRAALEAVNRDRTVAVSATTINNRFVLRLAILNRRSTEDHVQHAIDIIEKTIAG